MTSGQLRTHGPEGQEWLRRNESKLAKLSERQSDEVRTIALQFGVNDASRILKRLLQKKAPGPKPIGHKMLNGVRVTVYESPIPDTERRRVKTITIGETDSIDSMIGSDEDGNELRLADIIEDHAL